MIIRDTIKIHGFVITTPWTVGAKIIDNITFIEKAREGLTKKKVKKMFKDHGYYYIDRWTFNAFLSTINKKVEGFKKSKIYFNWRFLCTT